MDPRAITRLAGGLSEGSVLVSATNGKTTTAALAASVFEAAGIATVHNVAGANMAGGVASALLQRDALARLGLFEVDEFWLDEVAAAVGPRAILLGNLFRDQLDRYGELETIAERWAALIATRPTQLVLNADDPLIADLGREHSDTLYFGIEDPTAARAGGLAHASDSKLCRNCGAAYVYAQVYVAHLGDYACPNCGRRRPQPSVSARSVVLDGLRGANLRAAHAARDRRRADRAPRALQTSTTRSAPRRSRARSASSRRRSPRVWPPPSRSSGAASASASTGASS